MTEPTVIDILINPDEATLERSRAVNASTAFKRTLDWPATGGAGETII